MLKTLVLLIICIFVSSQFPAFAQTQQTTLNPKSIQSLKKMTIKKKKQTTPQEANGQLQQKITVPSLKFLATTFIRVQIDKDFSNDTHSVYTKTALFRGICENSIAVKVYDHMGKSHDLKMKFGKNNRNNDTCVSQQKFSTDLNYTIDARLDKSNARMPIDRMYISPAQQTVALKLDIPSTTVKFYLRRRN